MTFSFQQGGLGREVQKTNGIHQWSSPHSPSSLLCQLEGVEMKHMDIGGLVRRSQSALRLGRMTVSTPKLSGTVTFVKKGNCRTLLSKMQPSCPHSEFRPLTLPSGSMKSQQSPAGTVWLSFLIVSLKKTTQPSWRG